MTIYICGWKHGMGYGMECDYVNVHKNYYLLKPVFSVGWICKIFANYVSIDFNSIFRSLFLIIFAVALSSLKCQVFGVVFLKSQVNQFFFSFILAIFSVFVSQWECFFRVFERRPFLRFVFILLFGIHLCDVRTPSKQKLKNPVFGILFFGYSVAKVCASRISVTETTIACVFSPTFTVY